MPNPPITPEAQEKVQETRFADLPSLVTVGQSDQPGFGSSKYDTNSLYFEDANDRRAALQSFGDIALNGIAGGLTTFASSLVQGIGVGVGAGVAGQAKAVDTTLGLLGIDSKLYEKTGGFYEAALNNLLVRGVEGVAEDIREQIPIYKSAKEANMSLGEYILNSPEKLLFGELLDGVGFLASAYVGGGAATKGLGASFNALINSSKAARGIATSLNSASNLEKLTQGLTTLGGAFYGRLGESAIEANGIRKTVYDDLIKQGMTEVEATKEADDARNLAFNMNMVLSVSDVSQLAKIVNPLGLFRGATAKKAIGKEIAKESIAGFVQEGLEEGYQYGVQKLVESIGTGKLDLDTNDFTSLLFGAASGLAQAFYENEGQMSIFLGGVLGGPSQGYAARRDTKRANDRVDSLIDYHNKLVTQLGANEVDRLKTVYGLDKVKERAANNKDRIGYVIADNLQFSNWVKSKIDLGQEKDLIRELESFKQASDEDLSAILGAGYSPEDKVAFLQNITNAVKKVKDGVTLSDSIDTLFHEQSDFTKRHIFNIASNRESLKDEIYKMSLVEQSAQAKEENNSNYNRTLEEQKNKQELDIAEARLLGLESQYKNLIDPKTRAKAISNFVNVESKVVADNIIDEDTKKEVKQDVDDKAGLSREQPATATNKSNDEDPPIAGPSSKDIDAMAEKLAGAKARTQAANQVKPPVKEETKAPRKEKKKSTKKETEKKEDSPTPTTSEPNPTDNVPEPNVDKDPTLPDTPDVPTEDNPEVPEGVRVRTSGGKVQSATDKVEEVAKPVTKVEGVAEPERIKVKEDPYKEKNGAQQQEFYEDNIAYTQVFKYAKDKDNGLKRNEYQELIPEDNKIGLDINAFISPSFAPGTKVIITRIPNPFKTKSGQKDYSFVVNLEEGSQLIPISYLKMVALPEQAYDDLVTYFNDNPRLEATVKQKYGSKTSAGYNDIVDNFVNVYGEDSTGREVVVGRKPQQQGVTYAAEQLLKNGYLPGGKLILGTVKDNRMILTDKVPAGYGMPDNINFKQENQGKQFFLITTPNKTIIPVLTYDKKLKDLQVNTRYGNQSMGEIVRILLANFKTINPSYFEGSTALNAETARKAKNAFNEYYGKYIENIVAKQSRIVDGVYEDVFDINLRTGINKGFEVSVLDKATNKVITAKEDDANFYNIISDRLFANKAELLENINEPFELVTEVVRNSQGVVPGHSIKYDSYYDFLKRNDVMTTSINTTTPFNYASAIIQLPEGVFGYKAQPVGKEVTNEAAKENNVPPLQATPSVGTISKVDAISSKGLTTTDVDALDNPLYISVEGDVAKLYTKPDFPVTLPRKYAGLKVDGKPIKQGERIVTVTPATYRLVNGKWQLETPGVYTKHTDAYKDAKFRLVDGKNEEQISNEELEWLSNKLPFVNREVLDDLHSIYKKFGTHAYGVFHDAVIYLSKESKVGTAYHEALHAVAKLYLSPNEYKSLISESRIKGEKSNQQTEERLAQIFADYKLTGKFNGFIGTQAQGFFDKILRWIRNRFGFRQAKRLFRAIDNGKYRTLPLERGTSFSTETSKIPGLTSITQKYRVDHITAQVIDKLREALPTAEGYIPLITELEPEQVTPQIINQVIADIKQDWTDKLNAATDQSTKDAISDVLRTENFRTLLGLAFKRIELLGVQLDDDLIQDLTETVGIEPENDSAENRQYKESFEQNIRDSLSKQMKFLLSSIPMKDKDGNIVMSDIEGIPQYEDPWTLYAVLATELAGISSVEDMVTELHLLSLIHPSLKAIYDQVTDEQYLIAEDNKDGSVLLHHMLSNLFYSTFANAYTHFITVVRDEFKVPSNEPGKKFNRRSNYKVTESNQNTLDGKIRAEWEESYRTVAAKPNPNKWIEFQKLVQNLNNPIKLVTKVGEVNNDVTTLEHFKEEQYKQLAKYLNEIGINVNPQTLILSARAFKDKDPEGDIAQYFTTTGAKGNIGTLLHSFHQMGNDLFSKDSSESGDRAIVSEEKILKSLARLQKKVTNDRTLGAFLTSKNTQMYPINYETFEARRVSEMANDGDFRQAYLNDPYYASNRFLNQLNTDVAYRKEFKKRILESLAEGDGRDANKYSEFSPIQSAITRMHLFFNGGSGRAKGNKAGSAGMGFVFSNTPSDRSNIALYLTKKMDSETTTYFDENGLLMRDTEFYSWLLGTLEGELHSITKARLEVDKAIATKDTSKMIEYFHMNGKGKLKEGSSYLGNGCNFCIYPQLNSFLSEDGKIDLRSDIVHEVLSSLIAMQLRQEKEALVDIGLAVFGENGKIAINPELSRLIDKQITNKGYSFDGFVNQFLFNSFQTSVDLSQLHTVNIAYHKGTGYSTDIRDRSAFIANIIKRYGQANSPGPVLATNNGDYQHGIKPTYKLAILEEFKGKGQTADSDLYRSYFNYSDPNDPGDTADLSDAQGWVSMWRVRDLLIGRGLYHGKIKQAWSRLMSMNPETYGTTEDTIRDMGVVFNPIKGFFYGTLEDGSTLQVKYSSFPLIPRMMEMKDSQGNYIFKTLRDIHNKMEAQDIEETVVPSAVKQGKRNVNKFNSAVWETLEVPNKYYRFPQSVPYKEKTKANFGTQIRRMITINIENDTDYIVNGKSMKGENLKKLYQHLLVDIIEESLASVSSEMSNYNDVINILRKEASESYNRSLPEFYELALETIGIEEDKDGNPRDITRVPLHDPSVRRRFESILTNKFKKKTTSMKMPGSSAVQVSSVGTTIFNKALQFVRPDLDSKDEQGNPTKILPAEIIVSPEYFLSIMKKQGLDPVALGFINEQGVLDINKIDPELLKVVTYRIPTQGKNSMLPCVIKEFMPHTSGAVIMFPEEIVIQAGSDFDIDKVFIEFYTPEYNNESGKLEKLGFKESSLDRYSDYINKLVDSSSDKNIKSIVNKYNKQIEKTLIDYEIPVDTTDSRTLADSYARNVQEYKYIQELLHTNNLALQDLVNDESIENVKDTIQYQSNVLAKQSLVDQLRRVRAIIRESNKELEKMVVASPEERSSPSEGSLASIIRERNEAVTKLLNAKSREEFEALGEEEQRVLSSSILEKYAGIVDIHWGVLTDFKHWGEIKTPNGTQGMTTIIKQLGDSILVNKFAFWNSTWVQDDLRQKNQDGKRLVGVSSVLSSFHALAQEFNLKLKEALPGILVTENGQVVERRDLSGRTDVDGKLISDTHQEIQTAAVDNAKEPKLGYLNINMFTINVVGLLVQAGVGEKFTYSFSSQPIIIELTKSYYKYLSIYSDEKALEKAIAEVTSKNLLGPMPQELAPVPLDADALMDRIINPKENNASFDKNVLQSFLYYQALGQEYSTLTRNFRIDSKGVQGTVQDNQALLDEYRVILNEGIVDTFDLDLNKVKAHSISSFERAIERTADVVGEYFFDNTPLIRNLFVTLSRVSRFPVLKGDDRNSIMYDFYTYIFSHKNSPFGKITTEQKIALLGDNSTGNYVGGNRSVAKRLQAYKQEAFNKRLEDPSYTPPYFLDFFKYELAKGDPTKRNFDRVLFNNTIAKAKTKEEKDRVIDSIKEWYDSGTPEQREFITDLVKYSFITLGYARSVETFIDYIHPAIYEDMGVFKYLRSFTPQYLSKDTDEIINPFVRQYIQNNAHRIGWLPLQRNYKFGDKVEQTKPYLYNKENDVVLERTQKGNYIVLPTLGDKHKVKEYRMGVPYLYSMFQGNINRITKYMADQYQENGIILDSSDQVIAANTTSFGYNHNLSPLFSRVFDGEVDGGTKKYNRLQDYFTDVFNSEFTKAKKENDADPTTTAIYKTQAVILNTYNKLLEEDSLLRTLLLRTGSRPLYAPGNIDGYEAFPGDVSIILEALREKFEGQATYNPSQYNIYTTINLGTEKIATDVLENKGFNVLSYRQEGDAIGDSVLSYDERVFARDEVKKVTDEFKISIPVGLERLYTQVGMVQKASAVYIAGQIDRQNHLVGNLNILAKVATNLNKPTYIFDIDKDKWFKATTRIATTGKVTSLFEELQDVPVLAQEAYITGPTNYVSDVFVNDLINKLISTKEQKTSTMQKLHREVLDTIVSQLKNKYNVSITVVDKPELPWAGRNVGGQITINAAYAKVDTPFHEVAHGLIELMRKESPLKYQSLVEEIIKEGSILEETKKKYPELDLSGQIEESIVEAIGRKAAVPSSLLDKIREFLRWVGNKLGLYVSPATTISEVAMELSSDIKVERTNRFSAIKDEVEKMKKLLVDMDRLTILCS